MLWLVAQGQASVAPVQLSSSQVAWVTTQGSVAAERNRWDLHCVRWRVVCCSTSLASDLPLVSPDTCLGLLDCGRPSGRSPVPPHWGPIPRTYRKSTSINTIPWSRIFKCTWQCETCFKLDINTMRNFLFLFSVVSLTEMYFWQWFCFI